MTIVKVFLIALILGISGCGSGSSTSSKKPYVNTDGYPLDICLVTGEKLGSMGEPHVVKYQGKTVKFCCAACLKDFNKDAPKYMAVLEEAEKKSKDAEKQPAPQK